MVVAKLSSNFLQTALAYGFQSLFNSYKKGVLSANKKKLKPNKNSNQKNKLKKSD